MKITIEDDNDPNKIMLLNLESVIIVGKESEIVFPFGVFGTLSKEDFEHAAEVFALGIEKVLKMSEKKKKPHLRLMPKGDTNERP